MAYTRKVTAVEARVLGALMEKQETTPEGYPLSLNALVAACNQKSSREPVMQLSEDEVSAALDELRRDVLVWRSEGARVDKWDHRLVNRWHLDKPAKAVMTLLLLRGPQTAGELRTRAERLGGFASVDEVEQVLHRLSQGNNALVRELPRQPGQRETRWWHIMLAGDEDATASPVASSAGAGTQGAATSACPIPRAAAPRPHSSPPVSSSLESRVGELERRVSELERVLRELGA